MIRNATNQAPNPDDTPENSTEDCESELLLSTTNRGTKRKNQNQRIKDYVNDNSSYWNKGNKALALVTLILMIILLGILYCLYTYGVNMKVVVVKWSEGSSAWPDAACPVAMPFGSCDSNAQAQGDIWASAVCRKNGFESGKWTQTKAAGCNGKVAMFCKPELPPSSKCRETYSTRTGCDPKKQSRILVRCKGQEKAVSGLDISVKKIKTVERAKMHYHDQDYLHKFSNERSANRFPEPMLVYYKHLSLHECSGTVKAKLSSPIGDPLCLTGSPIEISVEYQAQSGEDVEWCLYVEVNKLEQQNYRLEVNWKEFQTRKGRSRVYLQKDSQTPVFSSGSNPPDKKESSSRVSPGQGLRSICVRWVALNTDDNDKIAFTMGIFKDIGNWIPGPCEGGGKRKYDTWWDGSCGVVYQKVTEDCPTAPNTTQRCGEYSYDQLCRIAKCGTMTLEDNSNVFHNGYGMIDPDDPDLYKIEYSKRTSFNIGGIIDKLKEQKAVLETRWQKYGGEKVFTTSINKNPYQEEAEMRLGFKLARALLLGDTFTVGFTGSSNTAGHHNMFYNSYPMQLQAFMRPIFSKHGFMGAAFLSRNNAWGGGLGTSTEAWCVKAMAGDDVDIVTWESIMNDGGRPSKNVAEIHLRNALFLKKRPMYHIIKAGKCKPGKWGNADSEKPWSNFNDHYHAAGAGMMEIWPCRGSWQLEREKKQLYVTWHPGPLGHRQYAEVQAWIYLNSTLNVLEPLLEKIQKAAPGGFPTTKLDEILKEPYVEPVPEPLNCGDACKGLGAVNSSMNCLTALEPASQEGTLTYMLHDGTKWTHEDAAAWGDNTKSLISKYGGMNANDRKFKWSGGREAIDGRFSFEIEVPYNYLLILEPYGWKSEKTNPPLPVGQWKVTANGKSIWCMNASDWAEGDQFVNALGKLASADPLTSRGCIFKCGAGLKKIEIWHKEEGKRIWIDNVIGV